MKSLNIVFAGTPEFGIPCLDALLSSKHNLQAVYTQPDRPAGRGRKLQASAVKEWATAKNIPVFQPVNFKIQENIDELAALKPDLMVVIAYGLILPQTVLSIPNFGCINVHASLLPRWRGASPIQHAILYGDKETGVTIMQMDKGMDTGAMLKEIACPINNDTSSSLNLRLSEIAASPLLETIDNIANSNIISTPQDENLATYAPKISKIDAKINWNKPAIEIDCQIRAFNPWPITYTEVDDTVIRIYKATIIPEEHNKMPGTILSLDKKGILVATGKDALLIEQIQFPGAKALSVADWLLAARNQLYVGLILQ